MNSATMNSAGQFSEQDVLRLIAESLDIPASRLSPATKATDVPEWDSMGILSILATLDREGVKCEIGNSNALQTVAGVTEAVRAAGKLK